MTRGRGPWLWPTCVVLVTSCLSSCAGSTGEPEPLVVSANQEPVVALTAPAEASAFSDVLVRADDSFDVDGEVIGIEIDLGDGTVTSAPVVEHRYAEAGLYTVKARVTDDDGAVGTGTWRIVVSPPLDSGMPLDEGDAGVPDDAGAGERGDEDGDGLLDDVDPDPSLANGALVEAWSLPGGVPRDLLFRQKAEDVDEDVRSRPAEASALVTGDVLGALSAGSTSGPLPEVAPLAGVELGEVGATGDWALRFTSTLVPPANADEIELEASGDDIVVVFVDGIPVASADDEYATNALRSDRVPASGSATLFGPALLEVLVANDHEGADWSVSVRLYAQGTLVQEGLTAADLLAPAMEE